MEKFIEKIKTLKATIAELQKCDELTSEQIEKLDKAVVSLKEHKAQKAKKADIKSKQELREMGGGIQRKIDTAMREGVPEEGNFERPMGVKEAEKAKAKDKKANLKLVKALDDAGHRESALLLKNWGEMDDIAEAMAGELEKGTVSVLKPGGKKTQWGTDSWVKEADEMKRKSKKQPVKEFKPGDPGFKERIPVRDKK